MKWPGSSVTDRTSFRAVQVNYTKMHDVIKLLNFLFDSYFYRL